MSDSTQKPSIREVCQKSFEVNGFHFHEMKKGFNQVNKPFRFMAIKYNSKSGKTHALFFYSLRIAMNYAYKKKYSSYNPFEISKRNYVFKDNAISRTSYVGNKLKTAPPLKYIVHEKL
jgi:hypothetical protein